MGCDCGKPKCDGHCGVSPAVLQINNPSECVLFHRVEVPASMGDSKTNPPKSGAYKNVLLYYEADQTSWLYSSDGVPQKLVNGLTDYEDAINLPQINGVTLIGDKNSADLKLADAPMVITIASGNVAWSGADTAEDIYNFFLNRGKVNVVFEGSDNYGYEIVSAAYIPGEQKMMCMTTVASVNTGSSPVEFTNNALYGLMTFYTVDKAVDVGELDLQPKLSIADFTGLNMTDGYVLEGVPATGSSIGMVKPGDGLEVDSDGVLSISDIERIAYTFDTVADMKVATNLKNGYYARTLGFHSLNDGGGALYKITDSGTANEMNIVAIGDLRASLIIGDHANVKQFGAYGDNTHDDTAVLQYVLSNFYDVFMPYANYYTLTTLNHTLSSQHINCQGNIRYQGTDFAIKFVSGIDCNIYYKYINAPNGGGILIQPTASCGRNKLEVDTIQSDDETFKVTGNFASSSWYIYGLRWNSITGYAVNFDIPANVTNVYFNRFIFNNIAFLAHTNDTKGILLSNNGNQANCDIQVEFVENNFEGAKGIRTTGRVAYLSINNCRISEVGAGKWLEFNGYIPHCDITTPGTVVLDNIVFNDITGGEAVNCVCKVYSGGYTCDGGIIFRTADNKILFRTNDKAFHTVYTASGSDNTVGDTHQDNTIAYVLPSLLRVEDTSGTTVLNVPAFMYNNMDYIIMNVASSTNVTLKYGTRTIAHTFTQGKYALFNSGNFAWYVQLS